MSTQSVKKVSYLEEVRPNQERLFWLMGESLLFQTNDSRLMDIAEEAFGRFPAVEGHDQPPLVVQLFIQPEDKNTQLNDRLIDSKPVYHHQAHLFSIHTGHGSYALAELKSGLAFGFVSPELLQHRQYIRINFVEALGYSLLGMARGYFAVHAACVIKDGVSVILHGGSGQGKSSIALACLRRGYRILAEDAVFIRSSGAEIELWGAPWKFHLAPDVDRFYPGLLELGTPVNYSGQTKIELELEVVKPGCTVTRARPGITLLLSRGEDKPPGIERLTYERAIQEFEIVWPWGSDWTDRMETASQRLLENGVYRLFIDGTPDDAVDTLDGLLSDILTKKA